MKKIYNLKKYIILPLVLILFSGCNGVSESNISETVENIYNNEVEVTIVPMYNPEFLGNETAEKNTWAELYKDYNIKVTKAFDVFNKEDVEKKMLECLANGNLPDISVMTSENVYMINSHDVLYSLDEVLEQYATDELMKYLNFDGGIALKKATIDGKLYGLPIFEDKDMALDSLEYLFIRKDWLNNLGLQIPETMEDVYNIAKAFKESDPDKNGKNDTIGLIAHSDILSTNAGLLGVFEAFGAMFGCEVSDGESGAVIFKNSDGILEWGGASSENMKQAVAWLKDMYDNGYLYEIFFATTQNAVERKLCYGEAGMFFATGRYAMDIIYNVSKTEENAGFIAVKIPDGTRENENINYSFDSSVKYYTVSKNCSNPEILVQLMNLAVDKLIYPESEKEYQKYHGDGKKFTGLVCCATPIIMPNSWLDTYETINKAFEQNDKKIVENSIINADMKKNYYAFMKKYLSVKASDQTIDITDNEILHGIMGNSLFGENSICSTAKQIIDEGKVAYNAYTGYTTENMIKINHTLNKFMTDSICNMITGEIEIDTYNDILNQWYSQGGKEVVEEANKIQNQR